MRVLEVIIASIQIWSIFFIISFTLSFTTSFTLSFPPFSLLSFSTFSPFCLVFMVARAELGPKFLSFVSSTLA
jgi:hypothetical protein